MVSTVALHRNSLQYIPVFICIWYLIFGIVLIPRPSLSIIQNTNSPNWEKIFCFAKEFTKVTWHLRHGGFNRIRQLIFHDYMSYRKINCIMPAKQTPHIHHTIHKRALNTIYFPPHRYPLAAAKMKYFNLCPRGRQLYSGLYDQTWQCVGWHLAFVKFWPRPGDSTKVEMK